MAPPSKCPTRYVVLIKGNPYRVSLNLQIPVAGPLYPVSVVRRHGLFLGSVPEAEEASSSD